MRSMEGSYPSKAKCLADYYVLVIAAIFNAEPGATEKYRVSFAGIRAFATVAVGAEPNTTEQIASVCTCTIVVVDKNAAAVAALIPVTAKVCVAAAGCRGYGVTLPFPSLPKLTNSETYIVMIYP